jgi:trans-2-enoyl-CoA reductase
MTFHTTKHDPKRLLILGTASVFAVAARGAAATDTREAARAVAVKIECGLVASSATHPEHGRTTFLIRNARRSRH